VFRALERKTGKVRWSYDTGQDGQAVQFHTDPLVVGDLIITGSDLTGGGAARLYAFEADTGKPRWKMEMGSGAAADILRLGPNVYALSFQDDLICVDWKTGELVWKFENGHPNDQWIQGVAPSAGDGRIFFGGLDGVIYALDANSGALLWKRELGGRISTSVLLAGGSLYAGSSNNHLYRLDPKTGTVTADFEAAEPPTGRMLFAEDSLVVFLTARKLTCLDSSLKVIRWSAVASGFWSSSRPYAWDHAVLAGNEQGEVSAFRISDGSRLWSERFEGMIRGIGTSQDVIYVGTLKGRVYACRLRT
jgi:outer membrane protein assembly factor BamB